jgi:hypothetical protein
LRLSTINLEKNGVDSLALSEDARQSDFPAIKVK